MSSANWWETDRTKRAHSRGMSAQSLWKPGDRCPRCGFNELASVMGGSRKWSVFGGLVSQLVCLSCGWEEGEMVSERSDDGETCRRIDNARAQGANQTEKASDMKPYSTQAAAVFKPDHVRIQLGVLHHGEAAPGMLLHPFQATFSAMVTKVGKRRIILSVRPGGGRMSLSFSAFDAMKFCPDRQGT